MSELLDASPSLAPLDADQRAPEYNDTMPDIDFDEIEQALRSVDDTLRYTDYDHYLQGLRVAERYIELLAAAKQLYDAGEYMASQSIFNHLIDLVKPMNNMYQLQLLMEAHDKLYR